MEEALGVCQHIKIFVGKMRFRQETESNEKILRIAYFYPPFAPLDFVVMVLQVHHTWRNILSLPKDLSNDRADLVEVLPCYITGTKENMSCEWIIV